ncbi:CDP-glycerol glycerophosphotransferase family protein [Nocardioides pyridinolyticus]
MIHAPVLAYFADDPTRSYQLIQWLPVLEQLDQHHRVGIVARDESTVEVLRERSDLPITCVPDFAELTDFYAASQARVVLYCNNSTLNFNSLIDARKLHVHINHGESDKQSMASNNAKAYDRVFVAGEAAVRRYAAELLELDTSKLVRIGRPQLDLRPPAVLEPSERRTVLYAPTWEGDAEYNDYTSVDTVGPDIVRAVLAVPGVRLVYKPHPKVTTSQTPAIVDGHREILGLIAAAGGEHCAVTSGDILAVMPDCDAMVTDVSSVGLDWLYLRTEKPIFITDRHHDAERLRQEVPVSRCADVLADVDVAELAELVAARLDHDEHHLARVAMRHHYFDDHQVGDSTARFIEAVGELIVLRDRLLGATPDDQAITA